MLEQEAVAIKKDMKELEQTIQKIEQEKINRDQTIRSLNDEIVVQVRNKALLLFTYFFQCFR